MPAKKTQRVKITLPSPEAKVFTSEGPVLSGSVLPLPAEEGASLCERGLAVPALDSDEDSILEPACDVEAAANNPNKHGSYKVAHVRKQTLDTDNAAAR